MIEERDPRLSETFPISGYAARFNLCDHACDWISPGAFRAALKRRGPTGIKFLFQHDPGQPIGRWETIAETKSGLWCEGVIHLAAKRGAELAQLVRDGVIDGLSIGFVTRRAKTDPATGIRQLDEVDLWEISLVTFPMQDTARVSSIARTIGDGGPVDGARVLRQSAITFPDRQYGVKGAFVKESENVSPPYGSDDTFISNEGRCVDTVNCIRDAIRVVRGE